MTRTLRLLPLLLLLAACDDATPDEGPFPDPSLSIEDARFRPVVLSETDGADLGPLLGLRPEDVVAFAYDSDAGAFHSIPVQVDERFVYDAALIYGNIAGCPRLPDGSLGVWCKDLGGEVVELDYADAGTVVGADPDASLDADDEVALLLSDFGDLAVGHPAGVEPERALEVRASFGGLTRYAYLYERATPGIDPGAGQDYVTYQFALENGSFLDYDVIGVNPEGSPPPDHGASNPEDTTVRAQWYDVAFADRWILDVLRVGPAGQRTPDLLEVDMVRFADDPATTPVEGCQRTPYTGSQSEGGILVNRDGPVRAIRRVIGFNSGPLTERTWTFYPYGFETATTLRVHSLDPADGAGGVMAFFDLAEHTPTPTFDTGASPGILGWQTLTLAGGGGWAALYDVDTSIPFAPGPRLFYKPTERGMNCRIDDDDYRLAHGIEIPYQYVPRTDPRGDTFERLSTSRTYAFGPNPARARVALLAPLDLLTRDYDAE